MYYPDGSIASVVDAAKRDLDALQSGGVDGILITNEFSMPYQKRVSAVTLAAMGRVIGSLADQISLPWGAEAIYDGDATGRAVRRCGRHVHALHVHRCMGGRFGSHRSRFRATMRLKSALRLDDLKLFHFVA